MVKEDFWSRPVVNKIIAVLLTSKEPLTGYEISKRADIKNKANLYNILKELHKRGILKIEEVKQGNKTSKFHSINFEGLLSLINEHYGGNLDQKEIKKVSETFKPLWDELVKTFGENMNTTPLEGVNIDPVEIFAFFIKYTSEQAQQLKKDRKLKRLKKKVKDVKVIEHIFKVMELDDKILKKLSSLSIPQSPILNILILFANQLEKARKFTSSLLSDLS